MGSFVRAFRFLTADDHRIPTIRMGGGRSDRGRAAPQRSSMEGGERGGGSGVNRGRQAQEADQARPRLRPTLRGCHQSEVADHPGSPVNGSSAHPKRTTRDGCRRPRGHPCDPPQPPVRRNPARHERVTRCPAPQREFGRPPLFADRQPRRIRSLPRSREGQPPYRRPSRYGPGSGRTEAPRPAGSTSLAAAHTRAICDGTRAGCWRSVWTG